MRDVDITRRVTLRELRLFVTAARSGSMSKAASDIGLTQPALSRCITELERTLGVLLFDRTNRGISPTPHGEVLLRRATGVLEDLRHAVDELRSLSGASGGDLLFARTCLQRRLPLEIYLPFESERFIETSVAPGGSEWIDLFKAVTTDANTSLHVLPAAEGDDDESNAYARCNRAMLSRARTLAHGPVDLICVWDGRTGDGPGGTDDMVRAVRGEGGRVHWIDTRAL